MMLWLTYLYLEHIRPGLNPQCDYLSNDTIVKYSNGNVSFVKQLENTLTQQVIVR